HGCDRKAAPTQVRHDLEILLDELAASTQQAYGATPRATRRVPAHEPQPCAVPCLELTGNRASGHRILSQRYKLHTFRPRITPGDANHPARENSTTPRSRPLPAAAVPAPVAVGEVAREGACG